MKKNCVFALLAALVLVLTAATGLAEPPVQTEGITVPEIQIARTYTIPENDAMALLQDMKCGWNLGNTFDSYNGFTSTVKGAAMETSWVNVKTSRKLIETLHEAGFNTIRIPVSWHNHVDQDLVIDEAWLARVKEVAGWVLEEGMYAIVNVHHDNDKKAFYPDMEHLEQSRNYLSSIWKQMAEAFRDCDEHLILESMNEPRLVGNTNYEWNWVSGSKACREAADIINQLNQLFVDTVRASGGNNATRYLLVPAYCGSPWNAADMAFQLPKDMADNRIIVEAHAYTPYNFALNTQSTDHTFDLAKDSGKKNEIDQFLDRMYSRFISRGVPVIMDEFGALEKSGNTQDRVNFAAYYVASATARGIPCVWWDNHIFSGTGERFGLIKRLSCEWVYPDIVLAIMKNCVYNR